MNANHFDGPNPFQSPEIIQAELNEPRRKSWGWVARLSIALLAELCIFVAAVVVQFNYWTGFIGDFFIVASGLAILVTGPWLILLLIVRSLRA